MRLRLVAIAVAVNLFLGSLLAQSGGATSVAYDYTTMYTAINASIVKIHVDGGSGSGFLVREDGLIATNHHVVRNSRYIAVEFSDGRKVRADVVDLDARNDLALLKVNRSLVEKIRALPLLPQTKDESLKAGIPVVAFGSPLTQTFLMTQGIISKVESAVLLGDFLIEPGNSGGPLLNLDGEVIGVNTFGIRRVSGAVRVNVLREALAKPSLGAQGLADPEASLLPTARRERFPADLLKEKIMGEALDVRSYTLDGGRFTITALTPVLFGKAQVQDDLKQAQNRYSRRGKRIKDEKYDPVDEPFYEWLRNASDYLDYVVTFEIKPDFGQTAGSVFASAMSAVSAGLNKTAVAPTRQTMEFKAEFGDFRLYRDGQLVEPIKPGRSITERSLDSTLLTFVDEAYSGMYSYAPETFLSGSDWKIEVLDAREPERVHRTVLLTPQSKLISQIRKDFEGTGQK